MKETRFIELLNLYVDQQLSATEATELEGEIQRNSSRRHTYQQYCRMQKGCVQLFEQERQSAPSTSRLSRALADADRKVIAFPQPRRSWLQHGVFATGIAAAAACVALVFFRASPVAPQDVATQPAVGNAVAATVVAVNEPVATATPAVEAVAIPPADPQTMEMRKFHFAVLPAKQFLPVRAITTNGERAIAEERPDFAWMKNMEIEPLQPLNASRFMVEGGTQQPEAAPVYIDSRRPSQLQFENAAFQYQKGN